MIQIEIFELSSTMTLNNKRIGPFVDKTLLYTRKLKEKLFSKINLQTYLKEWRYKFMIDRIDLNVFQN